MSATESLIKAKENLKKTLAFIAVNNLPPLPVTYTVCYAYASGDNPKFNEEFDRRLDSSKRADFSAIESLYDQFFRSDNMEQAGQFCKELENILKEILEQVTRTDSGIGEYGKSLKGHLKILSSNPNPQALKKIVVDLAKSTEKASKTASSLESYLKSVQEEANELREQLDRVKEEASIDMLTGLLNRKSLERDLDFLMEQFQNSDKKLSLLMIDIDYFKKVNDTYGHQAGDEVLKYVGKHISKSIRGTDIAGRYGGEEFTVVLPDTPLSGATIVAETIRKTVEDLSLVRNRTNEKLPSITVSLGVTALKSDETKESLIERADRALYQSKQQGRNRVTILHK